MIEILQGYTQIFTALFIGLVVFTAIIVIADLIFGGKES